MYQYGILDCAKDESIYPLIAQCSNHRCMFSGTIDPALETTAPYIAEIRKDEPLMGAWQQNWAENWGIVVASPHSLTEVRRHFRKFLLAQLPDSSTALFRFYDPRVLNVYFQTITDEEKSDWFERVEKIIAFDSNDSERGTIFHQL